MYSLRCAPRQALALSFASLTCAPDPIVGGEPFVARSSEEEMDRASLELIGVVVKTVRRRGDCVGSVTISAALDAPGGLVAFR